MKSSLKSIVSGLLALAATSLASAAVTYTPGDLVLAFRSTSNNNVFFYNLGSSVSFRDNGNQGLVTDLGSSLTATYGANWFTSGEVSWGITGVRQNNDPTPAFGATPAVVDGDPSRTHYLSRAASTPGDSVGFSGLSENALGIAGQNMISVVNQFALVDSNIGSDNRGIVVANTSTVGNLYTGNNGVGNSNGVDYQVHTSGGIEGTFTGSEAYLDLYRILATTTGANPTGTLGVGSLETTFMINGLGQIFSTDASAVPEPAAAASLAGVAVLGLGLLRRRSRQA